MATPCHILPSPCFHSEDEARSFDLKYHRYGGDISEWFPRQSEKDLLVVPTEFPTMSEIERVIAVAQSLLDGTDEDGPGAAAAAALGRASAFLQAHERGASCLGSTLPTPRLTTGPDGSIDVHWATPRFEILVNFPADDAPARFYGDDRRESSIKGTIDPANPQLLLPWLIL